jgi:signal transduction histidine kinase
MIKSGEERPGTQDALVTCQLVCEVSQNGRLVRWNPAWQQLLISASTHAMLQAGDLEGDRFLDWVQLEDKSTVAEAFEQLHAGRQAISTEFRLRGECTDLVTLHWTRLVAAEEQVSWIGTGYLRHDSQVDATQDAGNLNATPPDGATHDAILPGSDHYILDSAELAAFASRASHDIRAPLRAIHGLSQILREDYAHAIDENGRDYLERVVTAAQRLSNTVDGVTEYLRLAGYGCRFRNVDLNQIMLEIAAEYQADDATVCGEVVSECLPVVHGDPVQLRRLLHELVRNGIVHNASDVPLVDVTVDQEEFRSELAVDASRVVICVSDNGAGIQDHHREEIFAAFRRLKPIGNASGLGLGLATSMRIVRRHGGTLRCRGSHNAGSQFVFDLPLQSEGAVEGAN